VWNHWKAELLTDLYRRTMRHLTGDAPGASVSDPLTTKRTELLALVNGSAQRDWWEKQIATLPTWYLADAPLARIHQQLDELRRLPHNDAVAWGRHDPERKTCEYTVGTYEEITPGIFHKLTGVLSSKGLQILSASISTLAEGLVLDRFHVTDTDFAGVPPPERINDICAALVAALKDTTGKPPAFRKVWKVSSTPTPAEVAEPVDVRIDNSTAEKYTILDIFAHDRMGLLYTIARTIFELGLSVHVAKISTYRDQVLDVFYVTGQNGNKVTDELRLEEIRRRLLAAVGPE
jgi:[protein-PII] uridylyltransferase